MCVRFSCREKMAGFCHWWRSSLVVYCLNGWGITSSCNPFLIASHSKNTRAKIWVKPLVQRQLQQLVYYNYNYQTDIACASENSLESGFAILVWLPSAIRATFPENVEQLLCRTISRDCISNKLLATPGWVSNVNLWAQQCDGGWYFLFQFQLDTWTNDAFGATNHPFCLLNWPFQISKFHQIGGLGLTLVAGFTTATKVCHCQLLDQRSHRKCVIH